MITEEDEAELDGLSPEQRFCKLERILRMRLIEAQRAAHNDDWPEFSEADYAGAVSTAAHAYGIVELMDFTLPPLAAQNLEFKCREFRVRATQVSQRLLLEHGLRGDTVSLDPATKKKIGHWLQQIREVVDAADIAAEKKNRLLLLIDELQTEVDRERTPIHAAGRLFVQVCTDIGEGAKKALDPITPHIERICAAIGIAKSAEESQQGRLPRRKEPKRIEGPKNSRDDFDKPPDEEIPF